MPDTNMKAAIVVAERLRKRVEKTKVLDRDVATISVGVSTLESFDESISPALLLRGADDAMYEAKQAGRNVTRTKVLLIKGGDKEE